jgi:hypothetical protein
MALSLKGMKFLTPALLFFFTLILSSCETTDSSFGYVASGLDEAAIHDLVILSDEAINERNYEVYKDLFAPGYNHVDKSDSFQYNSKPMSRVEYLELVRDIFKRAKEILVYSEVTDINIVEPGKKALVTVREDGRLDFEGKNERMVSIVELEVGYEEGWIYFEKATTTAKQKIKE